MGDNKLIDWYIRRNIKIGDPCDSITNGIAIGADVYAQGVTAQYAQVRLGGILGTNELDIAGALGSFRIDVELSGDLNRDSRKWYQRSEYESEVSVHVVVLDIYDWHDGLAAEWERNGISDEWADNLVEDNRGAVFLVRGDHTYTANKKTIRSIFGVGKNPPQDWYWARYIGSQFDITNYTGGPDRVDYEGNPMK